MTFEVRNALTGGSDPSVLLVDDNYFGIQTMGMLLELQGYSVSLAATGTQALSLYHERNPAIVILDIGLPDMDGYSVARKIRSSQGGERTLIVAVTGWGAERDRERSQRAGCNLHLTKPVNFGELEEIIRSHLAPVAS